ncbi:hypothetical protein SAMN03080617_03190 [Algoriphagus alkaliphilus]|uniref:Glycosyl hydrolases family 16 n=1 Tax=Algoriphagus alkaliphilus TaxID=279824 RepID=A0A1G5Z3X3_9BACT|nr:hypothetical protein [Algoriphagus alkaliphilus]MBA4299773.1 hypothetical protein [Cyclobacterium sp.]SDA89491.1 hypothetical protein SAMN03080617_03190 [Algoriphagus alkaliphilus]
MKYLLSYFFTILCSVSLSQQHSDPQKADYILVWQDEFDQNGKVDSTKWTFEKGFVRNQELQWYQEENATVNDGKLVITGKREVIPNPGFESGDADWKKSRKQADYTSSSIKLYLDSKLLNEIDLAETINPDGFNPFHQPHYLLLNLALGGNGGDPSGSTFPSKYLVDYVRVYQKISP